MVLRLATTGATTEAGAAGEAAVEADCSLLVEFRLAALGEAGGKGGCLLTTETTL